MNRSVRNGLAVATMAGGIFLLGQAVASADEVSGSSEAVGSSAVADTQTSSTSTGGDAEAYGHEVVVAPTQVAESGGNAGAANSGNTVSAGSANIGSDGNGNASTTSGAASVSNTGGDAGNSVGDTTVSGDTSATGGAASTGSTSGSSEAVGTGGGGSGAPDLSATSSSVSSNGSGSGSTATTTATSTATGGDAYAAGHQVEVVPVQVAASAGNYGEATSGNVVTVVCFNYKSHSTCSPVTSSGAAGVSNSGGNAGNVVGGTTVTGNTSAVGGNASTGATEGTSESVDLGDFFGWLDYLLSGGSGSTATTDVSSSAQGGYADAYGHAVLVAPQQYAVSGGNLGYANSGNVVQVYCFNYKSDNNCNPMTTSGAASVTNTGGNAGNSVGGTTVGGDTSATGGNATTGGTRGSSESTSLGSGSGSGTSASTTVSNDATGGSADAEGHYVVVAPWQWAYSGGNEGWANSGNTVVVHCFNYKSNNNCNPVTTSGAATVVNEGGNAGNVVGDTTVTGCTSAVGGSANGSTSAAGCPAAAPVQPVTPAQPVAPVQPVTPAQPVEVAPVAAVQHVAPVSTGSGSSHATTVSASNSSPATLAYTGADVSDALGLGLLALAGGLGLALAGRRRTAA